MESTLPQSIEKESLTEVKFPEEEVLTSTADKKRRDETLHKAMILGNGYRRKVKIIFDTDEGTKQVETTIWAATEKSIVLKGGITIPIGCIREVRIF